MPAVKPAATDPAPAPPPVHRRRHRWRWVVEAALVIAVIMGIRAWQQQGAAHGVAPALAGTLLDGQAYDIAARSDGPVLVHFWASWCAICRAQHGSIEGVARDHAVVTVAMRSGDAAAVRGHLTEHAGTFAVLNDPSGALAERWGVRAVPASFIVDAQGRVRFVEVGYTTSWGLRWRMWWAGTRASPSGDRVTN